MMCSASSRIDLVDVIEPEARALVSVAGLDRRRPIEVEAGDALPLDPAAFGDQAVVDQHRQAGRPCHLLDGPVLVEP